MSNTGAEGLERKAKNGIDRAESAASAAVDEAGAKVKGEAREFADRAADRADGASGSAKAAIGKAADRARAAVTDFGDRAGDAYQLFRARAQDITETVDPFVRESPYLAVGVAALAGVILGALLFGGGSRVVYLKPRD